MKTATPSRDGMKTITNCTKAIAPIVRCAIYTRKSTEEGLEKEFNSLDAQRDAGEAFIRSQQHEGWTCLAERYDDGGFTGGNMERPALQRLLEDIAAGKVQTVVVYKVDRLSRSLLDFARMMDVFERHHIAFVSVTQQLNTATSMGRLVLNVLLSFAQFEREIISERTRDKIAATRRKGKWAGGRPLLGYDVAHGRLVVNEDEAAQVRAIFRLYAQHQALLPVVQELAKRGWVGKCWTTRKGAQRGGLPFERTSLYRLLSNPTYAGQCKYKSELHPGEHTAIIAPEEFGRVQALLKRNGQTGGAIVRNQFGALLKGLLRCVPCDCQMTPAHTSRKGQKRYRYYVCSAAAKRGWGTCPSKSIPAAEIERLVIEQLRRLGQDPNVVRETVAEAKRQDEEQLADLERQRRTAECDLHHAYAEERRLAAATASHPTEADLAALAEVQQHIRLAEGRRAGLRGQVAALEQQQLDEDEAAKMLAAFAPVWDGLTPNEQARVVSLLVERVDYDGAAGTVAITFQTQGIPTLLDEFTISNEEQRA